VVAVKRLIDEGDFRELRKEASSLLSLKVGGLLFLAPKKNEAKTVFV
jgi:hypothetical protein